MKDLIEALQIFLKYKNETYPTSCDHDVMYIMGITEDEVSDEDAIKLLHLGFQWSDVDYCWKSVKFGSA